MKSDKDAKIHLFQNSNLGQEEGEEVGNNYNDEDIQKLTGQEWAAVHQRAMVSAHRTRPRRGQYQGHPTHW